MTQRLDVVFVNPSSRARVYQDLGRELAAVEPPLWAAMLAAYCRERSFSVDLIDAEALELSAQQVAREVADRAPLLAVIVAYGHQPSASTQTMPAARECLQALRSAAPGTRTLVVGGHVSALPERSLREEDADFICQGEGPRTIEQLLLALRGGRASDLGSVEGLWFREEGAVRTGPASRSVDDLDRDLGSMAWDLLPMDRYRAHNWHCFDHIAERQPYASLYTSLGCPYRCSFCCINAPFGKPGIRYHSPAWIANELELLTERYGVRNVKLADEMFVLNPRQVEGICDALIERGLDLNIWAYARVDTVREGLLPKLARAGFRWLALGIESGSAHVRDGAQKKFSDDDVRQTVRSIQAHGIRVIGNYIFGLPDDTAATMRGTLDLALELNCEFANFYAAMAYPGSRLYTLALERGWALPETWLGYSQHAYETLPLPTEHLSAGEVLRFRDDAFHAYFAHPRYLGLVERTFGSDCVRHVAEMGRHRLSRKYAA